ncbi:hypothetical protein [Pedobacter sp.]
MKTILRDLNGFEIEVTDLDGALEQTELMKEFRHDPPKVLDEQRKLYWLDLYNKLLELKGKQYEQSGR